MTRDDIIQMAREAGISDTNSGFQMVSPEGFAALVAAAQRNDLRARIEALERQEPSRGWWDDLIADISAIDCMYQGSPTYAHDAYWMRDRVVWMLKQRRDSTTGVNVESKMRLFCDCKTDEEKSNFFLSGRAVETGVIAPAISNEVAMSYHRCAQFKKENDALRAEIEHMENQQPVAWCATDETGTVIEALGMNQSSRFDTALHLAPGAKGE